VINLIRSRGSVVVFVICVLVCASRTALAHDPGLSAIEVRLGGDNVSVHLSIARSDLENALSVDVDHDGRFSESELAATRPQLEGFARDAVEIWFADHHAAPISVDVRLDQTAAIDFRMTFVREPGSALRIRSAVIKSFSRGHREYVSVFDERGTKLGEKVLDTANPEFELTTNPHSLNQAHSFADFLGLGIEHILTGYDHLIFLFGLLLAGASFKAVAQIITSFTAAHSITLALSTLDLVRMPPGVIEPLIAVSIVYVGLENIFRRDLKWRWLLTFGFGLVHGFGFASALQELGIGSGAGAAMPLVSFNVGVEMGQITVAAIVLPLIWKLRERPVFVTRYAPVCSMLISVAGGFWLIERTLG
jgi:hydrogenase/urease accessory protein HupE